MDRVSVLLHGLFFSQVPFLIWMDWIREHSKESTSTSTQTDVVRGLVGSVSTAIALTIALTVNWAGSRLATDLGSVGQLGNKSSVVQAKQKHRLFLITAGTKLLAGACVHVALTALAFAIFYNFFGPSGAPAWAFLNTGVLPPVIIVMRALLPCPSHADAYSSTRRAPAPRNSAKYRVSWLLSFIPSVYDRLRHRSLKLLAEMGASESSGPGRGTGVGATTESTIEAAGSIETPI
eukprot:TRINITY_DN1290_c0_g1_i2.p1 TRINITY_DN1290_c0_g1~~TRINITY_DN1290_c0_g1_i2.p1  ORF type:complete len:235 (-),score=27.40 TRINITY_DN1290_c0_g1_i2:32-736(-)